ncbi:TPA: segregation/condensation protein A [archaeon]|nr:segregation/condensation protein A [Candidatus Naiadarchaeales archaeon SRR2090153.bin1042]
MEEDKIEEEFVAEKPTFNIEQILQSERAWEYILLDIVKSEELDPWDIDITKLTQIYLDRIQKMKELDLRIPARIILAAAILLRLKSETLSLTKSEEGMFEELFGQEEEIPAEEPEPVPLLDLRLTRKPLRKITLADLIETLEKAMEKSHRERALPYQVALNLPEVDISEMIETLYRKIYNMREEKIPFRALLPQNTTSHAVDTFLPLLHLANEQRIDLEQEGIFTELFILKQKIKANAS